MKNVFSIQLSAIYFFLAILSLIISTGYAADYNTGVTSKVLAKTSRTGNGQQIAYPQTDRAEVTAMTVELGPGAETGWHMHPVPVYAYVISGRLSVEIEDGKQLDFEAGEAIIEVVNAMHNGRNKGNKPVKLAVFYLGAEGTPNVIKSNPVIKTPKEVKSDSISPSSNQAPLSTH